MTDLVFSSDTHDSVTSLNVGSAMFLAWAKPSHSRRSELMARKLELPLRRIHVLKMKPYLAPVRYAVQAVLTLWTLFRERPRLVLVQNPPIFAPLFVWLYCALTGSQLIIDSHTDAVQGPLWQWSWGLHAFLSRRALTTLVTNTHLQSLVQQWGARSDTLTDIPSDLPAGERYSFAHDFNVVMVSSFSPDEPLDAVVEVARRLPEVGFYVTGDPVQGFKRLPKNLPPNLTLTGFLSDDQYYGLLRSAQAVMALTTENHTNQRGACEAVWVERPVITSDWPFLRETFHQGTVHVDNTVAGIVAGVRQMQADHARYAREIVGLQTERRQQWATAVAVLNTLLKPND
jgi:glycosyltransferase involved in cell wall biosynthesis